MGMICFTSYGCNNFDKLAVLTLVCASRAASLFRSSNISHRCFRSAISAAASSFVFGVFVLEICSAVGKLGIGRSTCGSVEVIMKKEVYLTQNGRSSYSRGV